MHFKITDYDWIIANVSGGKDSQVMLDVLSEHVFAAGVQRRVVVLHCDLGRVEWPGTADLARKHAEHYGFRFRVMRREQNDLLEHVEDRGMWPSSAARYCTSDHKRAPGRRLMTELTRELGYKTRKALILNVMGFRAEESPARLKRPVFEVDTGASNKTKRTVHQWLPIHEWTEAQVWERIRQSGVPHHWAYDAGMSRLSCSFCVLASQHDLVRAAQLRPSLARDYLRVEQKIDHTFRKDLPMAEIIRRAEATRGETKARM